MSYARFIAAFLLLALSAGLARADGLLYQLPKDGRWATYDVDVSAKPAADGPQMTVKGTLRIASVGQTTEQDQPCRWIEVQLDATATIGEHKAEKNAVFKVLIPEKVLAKGQTPLEHVVRAWFQYSGQETQKLEKPNDFNASPLPLVLAGPWKNVKELEKAEVESKLGKVACKGIEGTLEFPIGKEAVMKCKFEDRLNADCPFGVVTSRWTLTPPETEPIKGGPMEWKFKLIDFGENAKSKIPDAK